MNALPLLLARFQSWMQAVLVHPDGARLALEAPEARRFVAPEDAASVVCERGGLEAAERLQISAGVYPLRMRDTLRSDDPAMSELLGEQGFGKLVADYVAVAVLDAVLEGNPVPPRAGHGRVEVTWHGKDFVVRRRSHRPFDVPLLASLAARETIGSALEHANGRFPSGFPSDEIRSGGFAQWTRLGSFSGIERAS